MSHMPCPAPGSQRSGFSPGPFMLEAGWFMSRDAESSLPVHAVVTSWSLREAEGILLQGRPLMQPNSEKVSVQLNAATGQASAILCSHI